MTETRDYRCRRMTIQTDDSHTFRFPAHLHRVAKVAIAGTARSQTYQAVPCRHTLDIRDRWRDAGLRQFWLQQDPVKEQCTAKYLLPITAAILRDEFPSTRTRRLDGTLTMTRNVRIENLTTLLVHAIPPYLEPFRVDIYYYAPSYYTGERFHIDGRPHRPPWADSDALVFLDDDWLDDDEPAHFD